MGKAKWFFSLSGCILLVCALAMSGKGINFGIDFDGGTRITAPLEQGRRRSSRCATRSRRSASPTRRSRRCTNPELGQHVVQISTKELGPGGVDAATTALKDAFGSQADARAWSRSARASARPSRSPAIYAIIASLLIISIYIALRFEWKFAVPVLIALMHDILIVAGVYALVGREVTTSTVAALLTILGYSLYDTIIVFDRVRENIPRMPSAAFSQIVNRSLSEVIVRSLATSFCTLLPVLALMLFGGETLQRLRVRAADRHRVRHVLLDLHRHPGAPALEGARAGLPRPPRPHPRAPRHGARRTRRPSRAARSTSQPKERRRRRSVTAPPGQEVSASEFQEMVRDLGVDEATPRQPRAGRGRGAGAPGRRPPRPRARRGRHGTPPPGSTGRPRRRQRRATATPKDRKAAQPPSREAALMALLVWVMVGLALWHFTVFLPDNFYGGIVGAFCGALLGSVIFGLIINLGRSRARARPTC